MRIAIVSEKWTAGATRCARDLQRGLSVRHEVRYFPDAASLDSAGQMAALRAFKPEVVHLHSYYSDLPYSFLAEVAAEFPVVMTPHDPRPIGTMHLKCWNCPEFKTCFRCPMVGQLKRFTFFQHQYYRLRLAKRRIHARLPPATRFVCVSDWMRERIITSEIGRFRVDRIHNGIDMEHYRRVPDARKLLGLPEDKKILLFLAHHKGWILDEHKGADVLAQALTEIVLPKFPDLMVLAVGGGMIPNIPNVRGLGFIGQEHLPKYYSAADVFVAPSLVDNLPYTILEAMGCEAPVVASRVGGIPEEVEDGKTGLLFTPGLPGKRNDSWQELGEKLNQMLANDSQARAMGRAGRERVAKMFSLPDFVKNYEQVYAEVAR